MVSKQSQQVWGFYIGIWECTCVNLCAFQFNECHSSMVLWIEMTTFTKLSNRSTRLCYLIFKRKYWLIFFICSCRVNIPNDLTKKIANVYVKLVEENNEIIQCLCRNLPLYLKKNKKISGEEIFYFYVHLSHIYWGPTICYTLYTNGGVKKMRDTVSTFIEFTFKLCVCACVCVCVWQSLKKKKITTPYEKCHSKGYFKAQKRNSRT